MRKDVGASNSHGYPSQQVHDALVCVAVQEFDHALVQQSAKLYPTERLRTAYLRHDSLPVLAFHILEWHLDALTLSQLDVRSIDIRHLVQRNYEIDQYSKAQTSL